METIGGLQEEAERNFRYFEGVRVGGKGGWGNEVLGCLWSTMNH